MLINVALKGAFEDKVAKLNRRAAKLGMAPVTFTYGATETVEINRAHGSVVGMYLVGDKWFADYVEVTVSGDAPKIAGYTFLATVDLSTGGSPMVKRHPWVGADVDLSGYFHSTGFCQHCNSQRKRNSTLILRSDETGEMLEIGRNCAADFFRSTDAAPLLSVLDGYGAFSDRSEDWEGSKWVMPYIEVTRLFETACAVVREHGYASRRDAERDQMLTPTTGRVRFNLFPPINYKQSELSPVTAEDTAQALRIVHWLKEEFLSGTRSDEFASNIRAAVVIEEGRMTVASKNLNYLVWMVDGYKAAMEKREAKRAADAAAQASGFVGNVGERLRLSMTLVSRRLFSSQFGAKALCKFRDEAGNTLIWWGTGEAAFQMKLDSFYVVNATIKAHNTYEGAKQTELTRVAVVDGVLETEAA